MIMSYIWAGMLLLAVVFSAVNGTGNLLSPAALQGAQSGIELSIAMAGAICLWSGVSAVMEKAGLTGTLAKVFRPVICRLFPSARKDDGVAQSITGNVCANLLGLGNAATPLGIQATQRMSRYAPEGEASDEMCRLIVMNTASIQLIPANVAAVRASLGCAAPFDILPAVWFTSVCSVAAGLAVDWLLGRARRHD